MSEANKLTLSAGFDRSLAWYQGQSVRHLVIDVAAAVPAAVRTGEPLAVNLALVIDASSSMAGDKLEHAKLAAIGVVRALNERDSIAIVSFSNDTIVHIGPTAVDATGRQCAIDAIQALETRGMTNLSDGWFSGAEQVADAEHSGAICRVVLLSDGQANQGITDVATLGRHAAELQRRGISTSTVGIGDDYDPTLLQAIASEGGGRLHDAELPAEIIEVLLGELRESRAVAAEGVAITIVLPPGVSATSMGFAPHEFETGVLKVMLGAMVDGQKRQSVIRLTLPAAAPGDSLAFTIGAAGRTPGTDIAIAATTEPLSLQLVHGRDNNSQKRDEGRSEIVARVWHAVIVSTVARLNRQMEQRQARHYMERELKFFERYVAGLPRGAELFRELVVMFKHIHEDWDERTRKEMNLSSVFMAESRIDHRSNPKTRWSNRLSGSPRN